MVGSLSAWQGPTSARPASHSCPFVPSCWPPHFAVAPFTDYSALDAWLSPPHTGCPAFCFVHPTPLTDLTRRTGFDAPLQLRIAPLPSPCARAGPGSPQARIAPRSALGTLHRLRIAPHSILRHSVPVTDCSASLTSRLAPDADCSASLA